MIKVKKFKVFDKFKADENSITELKYDIAIAVLDDSPLLQGTESFEIQWEHKMKPNSYIDRCLNVIGYY